MKGKEWMEFFGKCTDDELRQWNNGLENLPRIIFDEFVGLREIHNMINNEHDSRE